MTVRFLASFAKDLGSIRDAKVRARIARLIRTAENSRDLTEIQNLKKLSGHKNYYRIRLGNHRLGLTVVGDVVTFVRCLDRKEIYRHFP